MKSMKVFFNGKYLRDVYPHATRWQVFKFKVSRLIRKTLILSGLTALMVLGLYIGSSYLPHEVSAESVVIDNSDAHFAEKIEELKNDVISKIAACESAGLSEDTGILVFDTNGKASIGQLQFQKATVIHYYKVLYGQDITPKEAVLIALDTEKASALAKDIIFLTKNKVTGDWYNCGVKGNLDAQVDLIKKLEQ